MRLGALNMNHKTNERQISPRFVEAVEKLKPDVIVLNEYVHGSKRAALVDAFAHIGP